MSVELFEKTILYLKKNEFIAPNGWLALYMWGDPFIHPNIKDIIAVAHRHNMFLGLSTNGSKKILFDTPNILSNVRSIWFSMPGFSQDSYDRSHGFDFEQIKANIIEMKNNFYNVGGLRAGSIVQIFHMYQYNLLELPAAMTFADEHGLTLWPYTAFFNDYALSKAYLTKTMDYSVLDKASKELFLHSYDEKILKNQPDSAVQCHKQLYLDEYANVVLCCSGKSVVLGSLFDMKPQDVVNARIDQPLCKECLELGIAHLKVLQLKEFMPVLYRS